MIKLIGFKRLLLLVIFLAANIVIATTCVMGVMPMRAQMESSVRSTGAQIGELSDKIQNIKEELAAWPENYRKYKDLENKGFFLPQDRFQAGRLLDELREKSGLLGYSYQIEAIKSVSNPDAENADADLINSRITLERISSMVDTNAYVLLYNLATLFPQHTRIQSVELHRSKQVNEENLAALAEGPGGFIEGEIVMDWLTVVPRKEDPASDEEDEFRGR